MDWTTTPIYHASVFGRHHFRNVKAFTLWKVHKLAFKTQDRAQNAYQHPSELMRTTFTTSRTVGGIGGAVASLAVAKQASQWGVPDIVVVPGAFTMATHSIVNGLGVALCAIDRNTDYYPDLTKAGESILQAQKRLPEFSWKYGIARGIIGTASVLKDAKWSNTFIAAELGDMALQYVERETPSRLRKVQDALTEIAAATPTDHPHVDVIEGMVARVRENLRLRNSVQHLGREM